MLWGYHDAKGGRVAVTDAKFSEGKNITREDVEAQWRREESLLRDLVGDKEVDGFYAVGSSCFGIDGASVMDCKMYDLPEGCEIYHFVKMEEKFLNLFLIWDKQRSFGGSEYTLVVVVPDNCGTVTVNSVVPTIVCGGKIDFFVSSNEILSPSVRSGLLAVLGQKELSVHCGVAVFECETDEAEVLLKDCPLAQQAECLGQVYRDQTVHVWERLSPYGKFCLQLQYKQDFEDALWRHEYVPLKECPGRMNRGVKIGSRYAGLFCSKLDETRNKFSELLHRGAKHNAVRHIKALAKDNAVCCIKDLKEKLKKLEGKLEKVSEKERLKK